MNFDSQVIRINVRIYDMLVGKEDRCTLGEGCTPSYTVYGAGAVRGGKNIFWVKFLIG